jgi:Icc-related predicted phosphoesterase
MLRLGRKQPPDARIFFATDLHGSTLAFRKLLATPGFYDVNVLVLGGDLTGKRIIPIDPEDWERQLERLGETAEAQGAYLWKATSGEVARLQEDEEFERLVLNKLACQRLEQWLARAEEVLAKTNTPCYVIAGNDDPADFTRLLEDHDGPYMRFCEDRVLPFVDGYAILGFGWSNPTPWRTPREIEDSEVADRLQQLTQKVSDPQRTVLNIHLPPLGVLDSCPELDVTVHPPRPVIRGGLAVMASVGSQSVRDVMLSMQPLLALCGHVHEANGALHLGKTLVVNPGSEYAEGILRGAIIELNDGRVSSHRLTSG